MDLHVCRGTNTRYVSRVRVRGRRNYFVLGHHRTLIAALRRMTAKMASSTDYKRGDILLTADYYEPVMLYEMVQR